MHPSYYIICSVQLLRQLVKSRITCQVWGVKLHASVLACISDSHVVMRGPCSFTTRDHSGSLSDKATTCGMPRFGASDALKNIRSKKVRFTPYKIRLKSPPKRVRCLGTFQAACHSIHVTGQVLQCRVLRERPDISAHDRAFIVASLTCLPL
jgi:hypothetical protein